MPSSSTSYPWTLVPIEAKPFNAETPLPALAEPLTPTPLFYVRNHFEVPRLDAAAWRLTIDGAVEHPMELSLAQLRSLGERTLVVTMECAGNGRRRMEPVPSGTPWDVGAVSIGRFTGTPLRRLLDRAGLRSDAVEVAFVGADEGEVEPGRTIPFARSLPLDVARHPDTLLAWAMNGTPLPVEHGFPLRLVVPRWYGMASVKWVLRISVLSHPYDGYFQRERYIYVGERGTPDRTPVRLMRVRAVIARPADNTSMPLRPVEVVGTAWSGSGRILRVEVSTNAGRSWTEARLARAPSTYAAARWRYRWTPRKPGAYTLMARATDEAGNMQPRRPVWNTYGYGNNVIHSIRVTIH